LIFLELIFRMELQKNDKGEWMAFNREYLPIGYNDIELKGSPGLSYLDMPIYTKYKAVSQRMLNEIAHSEDGIERNENGDITKVFLYNDGTNPVNLYENKSEMWNEYFFKLVKLSSLQAE